MKRDTCTFNKERCRMRPSKAGKMTDPLRSLAQNGKDDRHMKYSLLKAQRQKREWSQAEVAEAWGVSIKTVSRWEKGQAVPHPYYRSKLSTLFGKTAEELGLLSNIDENEATQPNRELCLPSDADGNDAIQEVTLSIAQSKAPDVPTQASFLANPIIPQDLESVNNLRGRDGSFMRLDEWELRSPKYDLFSHQSLWSHMSGMSIFRPFNRLSSRHVPIPLKILLTLAIIITVLLVFILQPLYHSTHGGSPSPPPANTSVPATYSPPLYTLTIQNTDPSSLNTAQHFNQDFNAVYPQLVNRFALNPAIAPLNVTLTFSSDQSYAAVTNGTTININSNWVRQHPTDVGLITHELTLIVEQYPSGAPGWFADGIADYARSVYGPADDDNWSLPNGVQPQDNYLQGGAVAACFLQWLEQHTTLDIVDQLNHALQRGQSLSTVFRRLTHHTVDELWRQYQAHPNIIQTPEQLYK